MQIEYWEKYEEKIVDNSKRKPNSIGRLWKQLFLPPLIKKHLNDPPIECGESKAIEVFS